MCLTRVKVVFYLNGIVAKPITTYSAHCFVKIEYPCRTNDMSIIECGAFRYDIVEVENGLKMHR